MNLMNLTGESRRAFLQRLGALGVVCSAGPLVNLGVQAAAEEPLAGGALKFPGPWQFSMPKGGIILVSDQQLQDLQDPDKEIDLSLSSTPNRTTLRKICQQTQASGGRTIILAFDEFWSQYRPGQAGKPRQWLPDTNEYIQCIGRISETLKPYGLGLELSLLSPLEIGAGYARATGESGRWVQYREGYRDQASGRYQVSLWEERRWTNNKGSIDLRRTGVRVFAFREHRVGHTSLYAVNPNDIVELPTKPQIETDESSQTSTRARRMTVSGQGDSSVGPLDRVLVVVSYATPEMDYFSPKAQPFLEDLVKRYHDAGVPLNGLYADEMHIQQDWHYGSHQDEGELTLRYLTPNLSKRFAELYGAEYADLEKFLVYFAYSQHGFLPTVEARLSSQHVFGSDSEAIQKTFLLRCRYYDLLGQTVVGLFAAAKHFAEKTYGQALEARAHATWAQSPTCDFWNTGTQPQSARQYEYTPDFLWSNTVQQSAAACSDYFAWNDFLTGGGNDHAEGGWLDRNYYGIALGCSTGILNSVPYAYAAAWGAPDAIIRRHQAVCDAFGTAASAWFQAVEDSQHRDVEVLLLYPISLVGCEERFGSWMVQYGYANYVTPRKLVQHAKVLPDGRLEMAGRKFTTLAVLFEPFPSPELLALMEAFVAAGGKLIWSGPPPRLDFSGNAALSRWQTLFGIKKLDYSVHGTPMPGRTIHFQGILREVPPQIVLTDFLVDHCYPATPNDGAQVVAQLGALVLGIHRAAEKGGTTTYLGFRPRDDQAASLGADVRTWFEVLRALGAYAGSPNAAGAGDNPSIVSRNGPCVACRFPNGTIALAVHYRGIEEGWPGGFHRDAKKDAEVLAAHPLPSESLDLRELKVSGMSINYQGALAVAFRLGADQNLISFAGYNCREITLEGRRYEFATAPMALAAWAPVLPERRLKGGATLELWVNGEAEVTIPVPDGANAGRLCFEGGRFGSLGDAVPCTVESGRLKFKSQQGWGQRHLFFVPA